MGMFTFALVSLFLFFTCNVSARSNPTQDDIDFDICKIVFCGKGRCHHLSGSEFLPGFRCDCDSGWKKLKLGAIEFPPCVLPNCTVDMQCGNGSPPSPPIQPPNIDDPCSLNFCGDGRCVRNDSDFRCECNEGSANVLNDPKMICLKKCAVGVDCNGFDLGTGTPPPPQPNSGSATGSGEMLNCSRHILTVMILAIIFQNWI